MSGIIEILKEKVKKLIKEELFNQRIGETVREKRNDLKITQAQLADAIGTYRERIGAFEQGKGGLTPYEIYEICQLLDINLEQIRDSINRGQEEASTHNPYNRKLIYLLNIIDLNEEYYKYLEQTINLVKGKVNK